MVPEVIEIPGETARSSSAVGIPVMVPKEGKLWLLAAAIMIVAGLFKGIHLLVLMAYLLVALWLLNCWSARRNLRGLRAKHIPGDPVFAGLPAVRKLEIGYEYSGTLRGLTLEDVGDGFGLVWVVLRLRGGQVFPLRREVTIERRGRHRVEPLRASTRYPFGLYHASIELAPAEELIVLPQLGKLHLDPFKQWLTQAVRGDGRLRRRIRHASSQEADIHGLREFRPGDSPRWIHWRSSARRSQLLVREFEDNAPPNLFLVVEPWLPVDATPDQHGQLEKLISLAATICREWCREPGGNLTFVLLGAEPIVLEGPTVPSHALRSLEALAVETGSSNSATWKWLEQIGRSALTMPMLALSSRDGASLAHELGKLVGRPVASIELADCLGWYEEPHG